MTLDEALAFILPIGKALRDASQEDWDAVADSYDEAVTRLADQDLSLLSDDEIAQSKAMLEWHRDFEIAIALVRRQSTTVTPLRAPAPLRRGSQ